MRRILAIFIASLGLVLVSSATAPAAQDSHLVIVQNSSTHEMLVTINVMLPALYADEWVAPGKTAYFMPGNLAWKGILYISVRKSESSTIDKNSPHICLSSFAIRGDSGRRYTAHYNGRDCSISQD